MSHLTLEQRYTIEVMIVSGYKRNSDGRSGQYRSDLAHRKYCERQKKKPKHKRFTVKVQQEVESLLKEDYSPEQVVGTLNKQGQETVSVERIYQHIWADKKGGGKLHLDLRNQGRRYRKRGNQKDNRGIIKNRIDIEKRPKIVEERSRFGDLEVDLIIGRGNKQAILTINDRASGMLKMSKVSSKESEVVPQKINDLMEDWISFIHTMTADNGKEFAGHEKVVEYL